MGIIPSRDTRRISFDNTFAQSNSALVVPVSMADEIIADFDAIPPDTTEEQLIFPDTSKYVDIQEERETDYWTHRIENLKKEHQTINKIIESEFDRQIEKTNKTFEPAVITHEKILLVKPCFDWRSKITQCYEDNPHQPLVCSTVVQAFSKCIASCRAEK